MQPIIDAKDLVHEYSRRDEEGNVTGITRALYGVSMQVKQGDLIAVLGANGSGKSTFAKHLNALLTPTEGTLYVGGMECGDHTKDLDIRKTVGMVFQNPDNQIVGNLVEEDIAFGPENLGIPTADIWNRVDEALDKTGMEAFRNQSPNHLSGGQKQRVAIAGVLAMHPKCIIFDESTAMLDPQGRRNIIDVARGLQQEYGITILLITHHMDEVLAADHVFVMKDGRIMGQGTPMEIFAQHKLLEECGLRLPVLYQYLDFLEQEQIIDAVAYRNIHNVEDLITEMTRRYQKEQADQTELPNDLIDEIQVERNAGEGILLNHVSYVYNKGFADERTALNDVNLHITKGEFVAVIGHTGSGKSTLMQHLNGLYTATEGTVYYNGQDIADHDFSIKQLRQKVGLVFQYPEYQLFAETVEKDVCFGPENMDISKVEAQKRAYEAIEAVGLPDTIYDCSPLQLSGGQKRRVAIAGILAMQPDYLVLDEPAAGLDPYSAEKLLEMLKDLQVRQGIAIILVSHSMEEVAEYADRIVVMDQGKICFDEPTWKVFTRKQELEELGLAVPTGNRILNALKNVGNDIDVKHSTKEEVCGELIRWKQKEGR